MTPNGTFDEKAVRAYCETMNRIRQRIARGAICQDSAGDLLLPDPYSPYWVKVELNAKSKSGFCIESEGGDPGGRLEIWVQMLFKVAGIDPQEELVKLRDAGCTFGGAPVLDVVKGDSQ
jgi:hypothetical protein